MKLFSQLARSLSISHFSTVDFLPKFHLIAFLSVFVRTSVSAQIAQVRSSQLNHSKKPPFTEYSHSLSFACAWYPPPILPPSFSLTAYIHLHQLYLYLSPSLPFSYHNSISYISTLRLSTTYLFMKRSGGYLRKGFKYFLDSIFY